MENKIDFRTLLNFSKGKYSYNDYLKVKHWFVHIQDDQNMEKQLYKQWKNFSDTADTESLISIFEKIQYRILLEEKNGQKKKRLWHYYRQVAAILIPIVTLSILFYFLSQPAKNHTQSWVEINVPEGARTEFMLPDSTSGWLNSGAKLKYPGAFGSHREVKLSGEAFFNVKHKENSDFTVCVTDMDIKVLGTQFNVSAYSDETVTEVVLKEGKVEIEGKSGQFRQILQPGDKISYNHNKQAINIKKVDPSIYTAWKDGYLVIDNEPFAEVAKKISRWYNTDISILDEKLKNLRLKATFHDEPLEEVLRLIAMTTPISYEIKKRDLKLNETVKKRQVNIKLK